ncbi:MAG: type II toxin-antitoxin system RelE/ParE family toxin [Candidatus Levybacteria bacterium]|nr:type II toxin-antitoxin system RelE/ParE family toxin [Candidatus Levybacteria bacterium]
MVFGKKAHIEYYLTLTGENPVSDFLDSLTKQQQTKVLRILTYIEEYGLQAVITHVKKLAGTQLWEIRILGKDNIRVFYVLAQENIVLVLHGFIKKKQRTPLKEIDLALKRYKDWLDRKNLIDK